MSSEHEKTITLQLDAKTAALLEGVAGTEGVTQEAWLRAAMMESIRALCADDEFQDRLTQWEDRQEAAVNFLRNLA